MASYRRHPLGCIYRFQFGARLGIYSADSGQRLITEGFSSAKNLLDILREVNEDQCPMHRESLFTFKGSDSELL